VREIWVWARAGCEARIELEPVAATPASGLKHSEAERS
jgi:hypothetical protein